MLSQSQLFQVGKIVGDKLGREYQDASIGKPNLSEILNAELHSHALALSTHGLKKKEWQNAPELLMAHLCVLDLAAARLGIPNRLLRKYQDGAQTEFERALRARLAFGAIESEANKASRLGVVTLGEEWIHYALRGVDTTFVLKFSDFVEFGWGLQVEALRPTDPALSNTEVLTKSLAESRVERDVEGSDTIDGALALQLKAAVLKFRAINSTDSDPLLATAQEHSDEMLAAFLCLIDHSLAQFGHPTQLLRAFQDAGANDAERVARARIALDAINRRAATIPDHGGIEKRHESIRFRPRRTDTSFSKSYLDFAGNQWGKAIVIYAFSLAEAASSDPSRWTPFDRELHVRSLVSIKRVVSDLVS